jgi:hypothetical protein
LFSAQWMHGSGKLNTEQGLDAVLLTCQDYLEEVQGVAEARVYCTFQKCLFRHIVCCFAARMLCSALPFNLAWQKGATVEIGRVRHFAHSNLSAVDETMLSYLSMLSLLRTLLCAPDTYSIVAAYAEVRTFASCAL